MAVDTGGTDDTYTDDTCHRTCPTVILRVDISVGAISVTRRAARRIAEKKISQSVLLFSVR